MIGNGAEPAVGRYRPPLRSGRTFNGDVRGKMMNQIFEDHLPYMIGSAIATLALFFVPRQTKWAKRLAVSILVLACLYPCEIVWLYAARNNMGESYGYLIGGILLGILMGLIAGALFLSWIIVYLVGIKKRKQTSNQASEVTARKLAEPQR
jgi:hypothetical protein